MARTSDSNVFLVKPTYVRREIGGNGKPKRRPRVWYLNQLQRPELETLCEVGGVASFTTKGDPDNGKPPRHVVVATVADVTPGSKHIITLPGGEPHRVSIPVNK